MHLFKLRPGVTSVSVDGVEYRPDEDGFVRIDSPSLKVLGFLSTEGHRAATDEDFATPPAAGSEDDEKTALLARIEAAGGKADRRRSLANLRYIAAELEAPTPPAAAAAAAPAAPAAAPATPAATPEPPAATPAPTTATTPAPEATGAAAPATPESAAT
jgi:hypothetical protein